VAGFEPAILLHPRQAGGRTAPHSVGTKQAAEDFPWRLSEVPYQDLSRKQPGGRKAQFRAVDAGHWGAFLFVPDIDYGSWTYRGVATYLSGLAAMMAG
jgi:hypothetical protein